MSTHLPGYGDAIVSIVATIFAALGVSGAALAATPASGTVDGSETITWLADPGFTPIAAGCNGPANAACDNFALTIVDPMLAGGYRVTITLQPDAADDWDLEVYDAAGALIASAAAAGNSLEVITLDGLRAGTYTVAAAPFAGAVGYRATASLTPKGDLFVPGEEQIEFFVYTDPLRHQSRDTGLGINWLSESGGPAGPLPPIGSDNGGRILYMSGLDTLRVGMNDCTAPATYLDGDSWAPVGPLSHVISLDNALFTDPVTGRTVAAQTTGAVTTLEWSDNDGSDWAPGVAPGASVDTISLGGGRLAEPLFSVLDGNNPLYNDFSHGIYACSQQLAGTTCSVSLDGANSFGAPVPVWTILDCGARAGRLEVSPLSGAAYLPNRSCGGSQGYAVSIDNGSTWRIVEIPGAAAGVWDPSLAVADDGKLYFAFESGGEPLVTVSGDGGITWSQPVDVGFGAIGSTAFPAIAAGDGDRAAFAFLGSETPGAVDNAPGLEAEWHLFVSMTFDGGTSWSTANVTAPDPVQRGAICADGLACTVGANLGKSISIAMDARGRPVVGFADGCIDACVTTPHANTFAAVASIARLKSFKGLRAAHDAERAGRPELPLTSATETFPDVELQWSEPGDGGNPISGYRIIRNGVELVTLGPGFRRYTDEGAATGQFSYEVLAQNAAGESRIKPGCDPVLISEPCPPFCPPPPGPCDFTGATVMIDRAGDSDFGQGTGTGPAAYDVLRLGISESLVDFGPDRIAFVLEVQNTQTLPPNSVWPVLFKDAAGNDRFLRMDTMSGTPAFSYGTGTATDPATVPGTAAEPESRIAGNLIVIVVPRAAVGANTFDTLRNFIVRVGLNVVGGTATADNMPDSLSAEGQYTLFGSENCHAPCSLPNDDAASTEACTQIDIDVLSNDSDPEGEPLEIVGVTRPANGAVAIVNGLDGYRLRYRPDAGFAGLDAFSYTVSSGADCVHEAFVTVTVEPTADGDGDGVMDSCDNCLVEANSDQCDTNGDEFGNLCDADLDNNGIVNSFDLSQMRDRFGQTGDNDADLDCNGVVNTFDLSRMRNAFGQPPGPSGIASSESGSR